ncbi:hypothetical protein [Haloarcula argentinensis]|nr:hypothetical protein [Haloarcula argentinensis]
MVSPNWPSEDDPDYTPQFQGSSSNSEISGSSNKDLEALREELEEIVDEE